jgi:hypothetical protein
VRWREEGRRKTGARHDGICDVQYLRGRSRWTSSRPRAIWRRRAAGHGGGHGSGTSCSRLAWRAGHGRGGGAGGSLGALERAQQGGVEGSSTQQPRLYRSAAYDFATNVASLPEHAQRESAPSITQDDAQVSQKQAYVQRGRCAMHLAQHWAQLEPGPYLHLPPKIPPHRTNRSKTAALYAACTCL